MGTRTHANMALTLAAVLLAAPLATTATASAAPTSASLTKANCNAQGGTFTTAKGSKTCVTSEVVVIDNADSMDGPMGIHQGTIRATYYVHVFGEITVVTTQVQRGKTITTTQTSEGDVTRVVAADTRTCAQEGTGGAFIPIDIAVCDDLGMYDLRD